MTDVLIPGGRDVRGSRDGPADPDALVVACPPHPRHGGSRTDGRLRAVGDALTDRGIGCLRIDYGPWDEGVGEREDVRNAVRWAADQADRVGLFGYSFGASEAILAAASVDREIAAVSALAPTASLGPELDVVAALGELDEGAALQVLYGSRDETVDWRPVVDRARERDAAVVELSGDHFFVGQRLKIAERVGAFLDAELRDGADDGGPSTP
ncbi:alpha/beta hydrolase [Halovivax sp.]|uniref:alpha/beta hydrolase n=1 Tax=Halovivax sp. TaxID=1935978 RepID=UPI0025BDE3FF|nr:alpha/beta hydrolase [Halovivax sp.]